MLTAGMDQVMVVIPASEHVSITKAKAALANDEVRLATEAEFGTKFPDCELGSEPPFGTLYGISTYVDERLLEAPELLFSAGSHTLSMRMATKEWYRLVEPTVIDIAADI
jgi:Ala-tRNA(Pro) deacylase